MVAVDTWISCYRLSRMRLRIFDLRGVEHRGENSEPPFQEISSQIGVKQCEVRPHHDAEIWRRQRARRAHLGGPGLRSLRVVLPDACAEAGRFDRLARRRGG